MTINCESFNLCLIISVRLWDEDLRLLHSWSPGGEAEKKQRSNGSYEERVDEESTFTCGSMKLPIKLENNSKKTQLYL